MKTWVDSIRWLVVLGLTLSGWTIQADEVDPHEILRTGGVDPSEILRTGDGEPIEVLPSVSRDPYEILTKCFEATIGHSDFSNIETSYRVYEMIYEGVDIGARYAQWSKPPMRQCDKMILPELTTVLAVNDSFRWEAVGDSISILSDSASVLQHRLDAMLSRFEQLDKDSETIQLRYGGTLVISGEPCHMIVRTNKLNADIKITFCDTLQFLTRMAIIVKSNTTRTIEYRNYKSISGKMMAGEIAITTAGAVNNTWTGRLVEMEFGIEIDDTLFYPPGRARRRPE